MRGKARCKLHGGKSPGPPAGRKNHAWKHGLRSRELVEAKRLVRTLVRYSREMLDDC